MVKRRRPGTKRRLIALPAYRRSSDGRVIFLRPPASTKHVDAPTETCIKCGSNFIAHEPAFIHCFYCGNMARIAGGSLLIQELWEIRSGVRIAS